MKKITEGYFTYWEEPEKKRVLSMVSMGHLVVENLLVESIKTQLKVPDEFDPYKLNYPQKVELCIALEIMPSYEKSVYLKLNGIRNKYAHQLNYELSFDEAFEYAKEMSDIGTPFTDDTIYENRELSKEYYGVEGIMTEILNHLSMPLFFFLDKQGVKIPT